MTKEVDRLRAEIDELLKQAQDVDAQDDAALGGRRGDVLPEDLRSRQDRLATIEAAMKRLEAEARAEAEAERAASRSGRSRAPAYRGLQKVGLPFAKTLEK